jgi:hypothetical protein
VAYSDKTVGRRTFTGPNADKIYGTPGTATSAGFRGMRTLELPQSPRAQRSVDSEAIGRRRVTRTLQAGPLRVNLKATAAQGRPDGSNGTSIYFLPAE